MDLEELHFADDSGDDPYEIVLLPDTTNRIAPENRLSPAHACLSLPLKGKLKGKWLSSETNPSQKILMVYKKTYLTH